MDKKQFERLWTLCGTLFAAAARSKGEDDKKAYWLGVKDYDCTECMDNVIRHSRRPGVSFPHVAEIVDGLAPEAAPITAEEERQMICLWARLHGLDEPPVLETAAEYLAWSREQRAAMREEAYYAAE